MKIYVPFSGIELPSIYMNERAQRMGLVADIVPSLSRPKLRRAAPGAVGKPHWEYNVKLLPTTNDYRKFRVPPAAPLKARRVNAVCWHAYKNFLVSVFVDMNDQTTVRTSMVEYNGWEDFLSKYPGTKDAFYTNGRICLCHNDSLAVWEDESHLKPRW